MVKAAIPQNSLEAAHDNIKPDRQSGTNHRSL